MDVVRPVHSSRLTQYLEEQNLSFAQISNQRIEIALVNAQVVCDLLNPDILHISSTWYGQASSPTDTAALLQLVSKCNATRFTPKAYTLPGTRPKAIRLGAETNIPTLSGLTENQFYSFLETSATAIAGLFAEVERKLPHLATWNDAAARTSTNSTGLPGFGAPGQIDVVHGGGEYV